MLGFIACGVVGGRRSSGGRRKARTRTRTRSKARTRTRRTATDREDAQIPPPPLGGDSRPTSDLGHRGLRDRKTVSPGHLDSPGETLARERQEQTGPSSPVRDMDVVVCHKTADFDSLAAAVGLAKLRGPGTWVVLPGGEAAPVKSFMTLHYQFFPFLPVKAVDPQRIRWMGVVDTQRKERIGVAASWVDQAETVVCFDHHVDAESDLGPDTVTIIEKVGAVTTLIAERIRNSDLQLTPSEATLLCLAIHADTGSLTFENTTARDASMLAWLMGQGASQRAIGQFSQPTLTEDQQQMLTEGLDILERRECKGWILGTVVLRCDSFVKGLSLVAQEILELSGIDALLLVCYNPPGRKKKKPVIMDPTMLWQVSVIGRARPMIDGVNFHTILSDKCGGGGHARAAAASLKLLEENVADFVGTLEEALEAQLPPPKVAADFMSTEITRIPQSMSLEDAAALLDADEKGGVVVEENGMLVGVLSSQDILKARRKGKLNTPAKAWARAIGIYLELDTPLHEAERVILAKDIGRIPVVDGEGQVAGVVTRSDVLNERNLL